jgi:DNA-directed RNA polymerase subunit M/transcription elongation factor TFIIS
MCPICGKSFVTGYVLNRHMRRFHKDTKSNKIMKKMGIKRKWNCSKCGYNFLRYIDLKKHELTHPMLKTLNCTFCSRKFVFHMHFKCHLKSHESNQSETENNSSDEKHKCLECGKEYIQSELQRHMLSHMNIKPYRFKT